jgi:hypothetical protein
VTVSTVPGSEKLVGELVRELQFTRCMLLLLEASSCGTGIVREPTIRGTSVVGSRYQTTTGDHTVD